MTEFSPMQKIKRRFFALRNGVVADTMRRAGAPYRVVFGLTLPQVAEIAAEHGPDADMARELWHNVSTRESLLLAPMLMPRDAMTLKDAVKWVAGAPTAEAVDVLCLKLLKHLPFASELASELERHDGSMMRYAALRLRFNLLPAGLDEAEALARREIEGGDPKTVAVARQLLDEVEFLRE